MKYRAYLNPIRLGGGKLTPLGRKKIFIFKWLMGRLCDLMTFIGNIRGSFWPNLRVISNFFELLQMFKVKMRPKKRQKIDFSNFESLYHKNGWSYGQNYLGGNVRHRKNHLLAPSNFLFNFPKIRKLSLKIGLFWPKNRGFPWITKNYRSDFLIF